jgi:hypothetical protein
MRMRNEILTGIGVAIALQLATSALAIAMLVRMAPAIAEIRRDNVFSIEATEAMLAALTEPDAAAREQQFSAALARARSNITEVDEPQLLEAIDRELPAALAADPRATAAVVRAVTALGQVNRDSMARADAGAQALARAGAWAAAILGFVALGLGVTLQRRLRLQIELPLRRMASALDQARTGNAQARVPPTPAPDELGRAILDLNWLLDRAVKLPDVVPVPNAVASSSLRRALQQVIDELPGPAVIIDGHADVVVANGAGLDVVAATPKEQRPAALAWHAIDGTTLQLGRPLPPA